MTIKRDLHDDMKVVRTALGVIRVYSGGAGTAHDTAGESKRIRGLLEVTESDSVKYLADFTATAESASVTRATAGESEGIIGSSRLSESDSSPLTSSGLGSSSSACARRVARFCCFCVCTCLPRFLIFCCVCCCCTCALHTHA